MLGQISSMQIDEKEGETANQDACWAKVVASLTTAAYVYISYERHIEKKIHFI